MQIETLQGQYFFQDLYNMEVYFDDFDDKSGDYFRLDFDPSFNMHAGKNLITIRGNSDTMAIGTELLIEAVDSTGGLVKTQIYDLDDNDAHERVIAVDITPQTPAGDLIVTIIGSARVAPDGTSIPLSWRGRPNMKWTRVFTAKPHKPNKSQIIYNEVSKPQITIEEVQHPYYELGFNQELSSSIGWTGNTTSSYVLSSSVNTNTLVSYRKSGDKFFLTAHDAASGSILDFGGFTEDMSGGIVIVRKPIDPRPLSYLGYDTPAIYAETEKGDGYIEDTDQDGDNEFLPGAYMSTILEVISPFEARTATPHTTWQGTTTANYQEFEHFEFEPSEYELIWSQRPISFSSSPTGSQGEDLLSSYAKVRFDNLEPLTGDVTRIKCYMKNHQAPFDWVLASDNALWAQELLYRHDHPKHRMPVGDFSQWGVGVSTGSLETYWEVEGVGCNAPSMSIYTQGGAGENPPAEDNLMIGSNNQALELDGTAFWWLKCKASASFYEEQWYELSVKAVSIKTQAPTWAPQNPQLITEPKMKIYLTGSAFTDGEDGYGKYIGKIEDTSTRKKHVEFDEHDEFKEVGYKFVFKADGTAEGLPRFKIESGIWHLWDISIKPWDRKGYTPGTFDVIFPTVRCNVGVYDSLDFKFEFYNDYGEIANYTAVIEEIPWKNDYTQVFTHLHTNVLNVVQTASFTGVVEFSGSVGLWTASDGYSPTGSSGSILANDTVVFTGSGGVSTSYYTHPLDPSIKVVEISASIASLQGTSGPGTPTAGGDTYGGWTASAGGVSEGIGSQDTVTFAGAGATSVTYNAGSNTVQISSTDTNTTQWWVKADSTNATAVTTNEYLDFEAGTGIAITGVTGNGSFSQPHTITIASTAMQGGGGVGGCFTHFPYDSDNNPDTQNEIPGYRLCVQGTLMQEMNSYYGLVYSGSHIGCPTTIGFEPQHFFYPAFSAEYKNAYAEKTWLQVNNWTQGYENINKDVAYAAIFNTTGNPVTPIGGDNCCDDHKVAGHGIKIQTSTIPVGVSYKIPNKGKNGIYWSTGNTCDTGWNLMPGPMVGASYMEPKWREWPSQVGSGNVTSGLANAYYIAFYHWDPRCNSNQIGKNIFAGGIRKDCANPENTIIIEYSSDQRLKKNIEDTKWSIDDLMKIKVRDFNWRTENSSPEKSTGFIAQELQEVYPQAAHGTEYDDIDENPMTVSPDRLIPLLVKSVQDQNKVINDLVERINKLENK